MMNSTQPQSDTTNTSVSSGSLAQNQVLFDFIDKVISAKEYTTLDEETREILRNQLVGRANDYINASVLNQLNDDQIDEFNVLMDNASTEQIQNYLSDKVPNIQQVVQDALTNFINDYGVGPDSADNNYSE